MYYKATTPEEDDSVFVTNRRIKDDGPFGAKGRVLSVNGNRVTVKLLTSNTVMDFDISDVSVTGMF